MTEEERGKTIDKVRKLLALAASPHEGEASLAMEKAGQILAASGLTMAEVTAQKTPDSQVDVVRVTERADRTGWLGSLSYLVAQAFDCRSLRGKGRNTRSHVLIFIGLKRDVEMASHFFTYLKREVDSMASRFESERGRGYKGLEVDAYRVGAVKTIGRRLREVFDSKMASTEGCTALVVLKEGKIRDRMNQLFPSVRKSQSARRTGSRDAYDRGRRDGEGVALNRAIGGEGQRRLG